jgi:predicted secreted protein
MGVTSALVLFAVIWSMTFLIVLPIRVKTQGDLGEIVPGTHAGAPEVHNIGKKAKITTAISLVLWVIIAGTILSGAISVRDLDWFDRMGPSSASGETDG